ncbi:hypothetical protein BB560_005236 [Smittium megazygosporum]|uniref:Uncharacterized protein n=1 Tax=Smittium megazygosporum TaxID=133381 RepID=A0A2T9Z723_9FUNG|nr:hypothetical protein BB560_005236 [Smittium megazygosporum]
MDTIFGKGMTVEDIWSNEKIKKESILPGVVWGIGSYYFANVFGKRILKLPPRINTFSSIATMVVSGILYRKVYYDGMIKKRDQLLIERTRGELELLKK